MNGSKAALATRPHAVGVAHAAMGDCEKAIQWLTRAVDAHDPDVVESAMVCEPTLAPLHGDPRYKALLARVGLTACRTKHG